MNGQCKVIYSEKNNIKILKGEKNHESKIFSI